MSEQSGRPVKRVDGDGRLQVGSSWESLVERQIREAMAEGKFDNLPLHGQPLPHNDNPYAREMALAFEMLKGAGIAPPWIEADKEVRRLLAQRDELLSRAAARHGSSEFAVRNDRRRLQELVDQINSAIAKVNAEAPSTRQHRRRLTIEDELARYEEASKG